MPLGTGSGSAYGGAGGGSDYGRGAPANRDQDPYYARAASPRGGYGARERSRSRERW
jgi:hypothetical protein